MLRSKAFLVLFLLVVATACSGPKHEVSDDKPGFEEAGFVLHTAREFYSWTKDRIPLVSAHRGGPYSGLPENAIATFDNIASKTPAVIECDIAMTKDSVLVMMHDNSLDRTTTGTGKVIDHSWEELQCLFLVDHENNQTSYRIPTLKEVLEWGKGRVLFTLDVKRGVPFKKVVEMVRQTDTDMYAAIITYSANDAQTVYNLDPELMISVGIGNRQAYEAHKKLGIPDENMIAFVGVSEPEPALYKFLHEKGIYCILGVLGNLDKQATVRGDSIYAGFINRGADILATDRPVEAAAILKNLVPASSSKRQFFHDY